MKMKTTVRMIAAESYVSKKTNQVYSKVLLNDPGTVDVVTVLCEDVELLDAPPGELYDCIFDYNEKYQSLKLLSMRPQKPAFNNPGPNPEAKAAKAAQ